VKNLIAFALLALIGPRPAAADTELRRFALIVGADDGGPGRVPLRFAAADARAFAEVLDELGGLAPDDRILLVDPDRRQLEGGLAQLGVMLASAPSGERRELVVYYSGHSDEDGLLLGGERVGYADLRKTIDALPADVRITILDSCASGTLTREKGGRMRPPFLLDRSADVRGYAILTSASADEAAQESDRVGGSFFTHFLVSGLRGAADASGDGRVTLDEAYRFAFHETLARTEGTRSGPQHPSYDFQLAGSGDVVLTDLHATSARMRLPEALDGRLFVRDAEGRLVAELRKAAGHPVVLGLPPGKYALLLDRDGALSRGSIELAEGAETPVDVASLAPAEGEVATLRGGVAPRFRAVEVSLVPPLTTNLLADEPLVNAFSLGLIGGYSAGIEGAAIGGAFHWIDGPVTGVAVDGALGYERGALTGVQIAGAVAWAGGAATGVQIGGALDVAGDVTGAQIAGAVDVAGDLTGAQIAGAVNVAGDVTGAQIAPFNVAKRVRGLQIGVINVADHVDGVPLGVVSWVRDGIHEARVWGSDLAPVNVGLTLGSHVFYTRPEVGFAFGDTSRQFAGFALGGRIPAGPLHVDVEAYEASVYEDGFKARAGLVTGARAIVGARIAGDLAVFAGPTLNLHVGTGDRATRAGEDLAFGPQKTWRSGDTTVRMWPGAVLGLAY
jgi:hypothetical protein